MYIESPTNILRTSFDNTTQSKRSSTSSRQSKISIDVQFGCVEASIEKSNEYISSILRTSNRRTIQTNIQRTSLKSRSTIKSNEYPSKRAFNENASNFYQLYNTNKSKIQRRSNEHLSKIQRTLTEHVSKALYRSSSEHQSKPYRT